MKIYYPRTNALLLKLAQRIVASNKSCTLELGDYQLPPQPTKPQLLLEAPKLAA